MEYIAVIKWHDTGEIMEYRVKVGSTSNNDDQIFFYFQSEEELEDFKKEDHGEFVVLEAVRVESPWRKRVRIRRKYKWFFNLKLSATLAILSLQDRFARLTQ